MIGVRWNLVGFDTGRYLSKIMIAKVWFQNILNQVHIYNYKGGDGRVAG